MRHSPVASVTLNGRVVSPVSARLLISDLTKPVDVYCEWLDACKEANEKNPADSKAKLGHIEASDEEEEKKVSQLQVDSDEENDL